MKFLLRKSIVVPLFTVTLVFGLVVWMSFSAVGYLLSSGAQTERMHEMLRSLETILAAATDAETGQRGFMLTGEEAYLEPYVASRARSDGELRHARQLAEAGSFRQIDFSRLTMLIDERALVLERQIALRRENGLAAGVVAVREGDAKAAMDRIRVEIAGLARSGELLLEQSRREARKALEQATFAGTCGIVVCVLLFGFVFHRIEHEMTQRTAAEQALRAAHADLEIRVANRTAELRNAEEEARAAREKAEAANGAKTDFLSRVSHELRTPLNAILGFGQLMEMEGRLSAGQTSNLQHMMRGGRHLLDLVDELLDLTAVESGRLPLSLEPVPLQQAVGDALNMISPLTQRGSVRVVVHPFPFTDAHVTADRQRLMQVLLNLFSNAVKFNRRDGSVDIFCEIAGEGRLRLIIRDTGPGISPAGLERLFAPFERLEASASEGLGLGLILAKRLMTAMGGELGVDSKVGEGSTFWIELLRAEPPLGTPAASPGPGHKVDHGLHGKTVLYIEDNLANLKLIEHILQDRPGMTLLSSMQGSLGLELAFGKNPDLILLDLHLPDIGGREVLRRLRVEPATRDTPVIILTADVTPRRMERVLNEGAQACLTKPIDVRQFLGLLDRMLASESLDQPAT
jgi:signal transduction histidine kinase